MILFSTATEVVILTQFPKNVLFIFNECNYSYLVRHKPPGECFGFEFGKYLRFEKSLHMFSALCIILSFFKSMDAKKVTGNFYVEKKMFIELSDEKFGETTDSVVKREVSSRTEIARN